MRQSEAISKRLCDFINSYAKAKKTTPEDAAQHYFGISSYDFRDMLSGKKIPSLRVCEVAIKRGCHPRYLFLGDIDIPGDPVRCFSYRRGNCRVFDFPQCPGYDKCSFYKSEQMYLALSGSVRV